MSKSNELDRRKVVVRLLADRKDAVVVPGLGSCNYDITAAGDHDRNFYNWGAMGGAAMIGLGNRAGAAEGAGGGHHGRWRNADGHWRACDDRA